MQDRIPFLCNAGQSHSLPADLFVPIHAEDQLEAYLNDPTVDVDTGVLITAELRWDKHLYSDFYGLEMIGKIRTLYASRRPILLTSYANMATLGLTTFRGKGRYWKDPSLAYVSLAELECMDAAQILSLFRRPLDPELHDDLRESIYERKGYLGELFHDLWELSQNDSKVNILEAIAHCFDKIRRLFPGELATIGRVQRELERKWKVEKILPLHISLHELKAHLGSERKLAAQAPSEAWKVLLIDDRPPPALLDCLKAWGIGVQQAASYEQAKAILAKDVKNQITVVICDYRFFDPSGRYQYEQGYHIINQLAHLPNYLAFITLSNYEQYSLQRFFEKHHIKATSFSKNDILGNRHQEVKLQFVQKIIAENARIQALIQELPDFKPIQHRYYQKHISAPDYARAEQRISSMALGLVQKVVKSNGVKSIKAFLNHNFQGHLNNRSEARNLQNFREKLLGRRVALGLCQLYKSRLSHCQNKKELWLTITSILRTGCIEIGEEAGLRDLVNTHLRLSVRKSYPWDEVEGHRLTLEEKSWLRKSGPQLQQIPAGI